MKKGMAILGLTLGAFVFLFTASDPLLYAG